MLPLGERPWRVRCGWVLPPTPDPDDAPGPAGSGWVWASDSADRKLALEGRIEDGFLAVEGVRSASERNEGDIVSTPATAASIHEACIGTVRRGKGTGGARLHRVRARRMGAGADLPMVFPSDPARPRPVSRMVVFGDSLSDVGNLKRRIPGFPSSPYWVGRFANGPMWTDHLEARTGLSVQNRAYGGALATGHPEIPAEDLKAAVRRRGQLVVTGSLDNQVRKFLERKLANGVVQRPEDTVFVVWGGGNDYISKEPFSGDIRTLLDADRDPGGYLRVVDEVVAALADQVRRLHAAGARRVAVVNLPNLGLTPIVLHNTTYRREAADGEPTMSDESRRIELAQKLGDLTLHHNRELGRAVGQLVRELPGATILYVNAARAFDDMLRRNAPGGTGLRFDYGFDLRSRGVVLEDAGRRLWLQDRCYSGSYLGSKDPTTVCQEAGTVLFWDTLHPTSYTHCWIAFFVARDMARVGWLPKAPSLDSHRAYCAGAARLGTAALPVS